MSRTATATPPPPYFPQRTSTPTIRHASAPHTHVAHFPRSAPHHSPEKRAGRRIKHLPPSLSGLKGKKNAAASGSKAGEEEEVLLSSGVMTPPLASPSPPDLTSDSQSTSTSSASVASTSLNTPASLDASFIHPHSSVDYTHDAPNVIISSPPNVPTSTPPTSRSWVPHFALSKVAKAVLPSGFSAPWSGVSLGDKKKKPVLALEVDIPVVWEVDARSVEDGEGIFTPEARAAIMPQEMLEGLDEEGVRKKKREWAEAQHLKLTECARLCSQWPQSGYNISKWGPNGAKHCYEPQSYANPNHVTEVMSRQCALETHLTSTNSLFFPSSHSTFSTPRYSSSTDSTAESYDNSALPSPTTTAASDHELSSELRQAMTSPLIGYSAGASLVSLLLPPAQTLRNAQSLSELNRLARDMILSKSSAAVGNSGERMEVDTDTETVVSLSSSQLSAPPSDSPPAMSASTTELSAPRVTTRPARAASCGSKRPLPPPVPSGSEEEKRRKVDDEAMVVDDAVSSGVIMAPPPSSSPLAPLVANTTSTPAGEVFGHVVKTSDTHPIIISPFFPTDLLPILSSHLVPPPSGSPPLYLKSDIDVPALLLAQGSGVLPSPISSTFSHLSSASSSSLNLSLSLGLGGLGTYLGGSVQSLGASRPKLGNLLLSSCPGKRLRMGGPVKGRGPVCRDLKTDLGRIKAEGVGAVVCCLDDSELALLGTTWETYRGVANELGLDIIRFPMPDGFTPVSLGLFDQQVTLICSRYSLKGVNVLVHCRGGVGRAGVTACAWAIKMGFVQPHPSLVLAEEGARRQFALDAAPAPAPAAMAPSKSGGIIPFFSAQNRSHTSSPAPPAAKEVKAEPLAELSPELEHQIVMSIVERVVAMIRSRRGLKAIESFEQVQFLKVYVGWLRAGERGRERERERRK